MPASDLTPGALARTLGVLSVAQDIVIDAIRGKPITQDGVAQVRQALVSARQVLDALDETHPWTP